MFTCERGNKPPFDVITHDAYCDVCGEHLGHHEIEEKVYITIRAGKIVERESIKLSNQSQFNTFVRGLENEGHWIIREPGKRWAIPVGAFHHHRRRTRNLDCICARCIAPQERPYKGFLRLLEDHKPRVSYKPYRGPKQEARIEKLRELLDKVG